MKTQLEGMIDLLSGRCSEAELATFQAELNDETSHSSQFLFACGQVADRTVGGGGSSGVVSPTLPPIRWVDDTPPSRKKLVLFPAKGTEKAKSKKTVKPETQPRSKKSSVWKWGLAAAAALLLISVEASRESLESENASLERRLASEQEGRQYAERRLTVMTGLGGFSGSSGLPIPTRGSGIGLGQPKFGSSLVGLNDMPRPDYKYVNLEYYSDAQLEKLKQWLRRQPAITDDEKRRLIQWNEQSNNNTKTLVSWYKEKYPTDSPE